MTDDLKSDVHKIKCYCVDQLFYNTSDYKEQEDLSSYSYDDNYEDYSSSGDYHMVHENHEEAYDYNQGFSGFSNIQYDYSYEATTGSNGLYYDGPTSGQDILTCSPDSEREHDMILAYCNQGMVFIPKCCEKGFNMNLR